jgi:hypothetical protein
VAILKKIWGIHQQEAYLKDVEVRHKKKGRILNKSYMQKKYLNSSSVNLI